MKDAKGGRRFLLCAGVCLAASALLLVDRLTGALWVDVVKWIAGIYVIGNTGQRGIEAVKDVKLK